MTICIYGVRYFHEQTPLRDTMEGSKKTSKWTLSNFFSLKISPQTAASWNQSTNSSPAQTVWLQSCLLLCACFGGSHSVWSRYCKDAAFWSNCSSNTQRSKEHQVCHTVSANCHQKARSSLPQPVPHVTHLSLEFPPPAKLQSPVISALCHLVVFFKINEWRYQ